MKTNITYCCQDCGTKISSNSALYGLGRCRSCSKKEINHPFFNKKHSKETKLKMSKSAIGKHCGEKSFWFGKVKKFSKETRLKLSNAIRGIKRSKETIQKLSGKNSVHYGRCVNIFQLFYYKNSQFRSSWEANFAKWCDGSGIKWKYEPKHFDLGNTTYTPDFYLPEFDCYIEIKGYWRKDAKEKVEKFISLNPKINYKIFEKQKLKEIGVI